MPKEMGKLVYFCASLDEEWTVTEKYDWTQGVNDDKLGGTGQGPFVQILLCVLVSSEIWMFLPPHIGRAALG